MLLWRRHGRHGPRLVRFLSRRHQLLRLSVAELQLLLLLLLKCVPDRIADLDYDLGYLFVLGQRLLDVRVVRVDRVHVRLQLEQIERHHLAAEAHGSLVLEEPFLVVLFAVEQLLHLVFFAFDLISDLLASFEGDLLSLVRAKVDREELLRGGLDAEQVSVLHGEAIPQCRLAR